MRLQISFSAAIVSISLISLSASTPVTNSPREQPAPRSYGVLLYRAFDPLDIFGPLEVLQALSKNYTVELHLLSRTLDPVLSSPLMPSMNPANSSFFPTLLPTDTFTSNPAIDVLIIPGGAGMRNPNMTEEIEYVKAVYPTLKYVITVCTGSAFLARTGLLDGRRATTNKQSWKGVIGFGPKVRWVSPARWVVDGNIWTSAGVTAGIDTTLEFVRTMYPDGDELVKGITRSIEYEQHPQDWDPFSAMSGIPPQNLE